MDMKVKVGTTDPGTHRSAASGAGSVHCPNGGLIDCDGRVRLTVTFRRLSVLEAAEKLHGIKPQLAQVWIGGRCIYARLKFAAGTGVHCSHLK